MATNASLGANLRLNGEQFEQLSKGLRSAYRSFDNLKQLVLFDLDVPLEEIVSANANLTVQTVQLIEWAEAQGRTVELIKAARGRVPGNGELAEAAAAILPTDVLEKIVNKNPELFSNPAAWRQGMIQAEWAVCRIENPSGTPWGTGFLVGPDLVLTNDHVRREGRFDDSAATARCRFGYRELADGKGQSGKTYPLSDQWLVHNSPDSQLDYALLRLSEPAAEDPVGTFVEAPPRKWLKCRTGELHLAQALFILQHPLGETIKMANGGLKKFSPPWMEYEINTEHGSSGSPVLNNTWELVGLHSRYGTANVNKGVHINAILDNLPSDVRGLLDAD